MAFYNLSKAQRLVLVDQIHANLLDELKMANINHTLTYFKDADTYIRKSAYLAIGKIYWMEQQLQAAIIKMLDALLLHSDFKVRQTVINAAGEIGKKDFAVVQHFFDQGLFDEHHSPRNAVIGSIKKMGELNPTPVLTWAASYLHHPDKEIRREICHGIELRGRKHPQDILPLLQQLEHDKTKRVSQTLVHVIGQIAYKKGCLPIVIKQLQTWQNKELVTAALIEIIDVHERYKDFAALTQEQAIQYIKENYTNHG